MKKGPQNLLFVMALAALFTLLIRVVAVSNQHVDIYDIELLNLQKNELLIGNNQIKESIGQVDATIADIKSKMNNREALAELRRAVANYRILAGETAVCGEGVVIVVDDSGHPLSPLQDPEDAIVHDANLRVIVDELWQAGAEAISVNGTRVIFGVTMINCSGPTININRVEHSAPYIIRAIGDRYALQRKMTEDGSYANTMQRFALNVEVNTKVYLKIDGYSGLATQSHVKVVTEWLCWLS